MSTSKSDITDRVCERIGSLKGETNKIVSAAIDVIADALRNGETVRLAGLGTFDVKNTQERQARNPLTGDPVTVKAGKKVKFKVADDLKRGL